MIKLNKKHPFEQLNLNQLNSILKNINLGKEHLSNVLTPNEMQHLLEQVDLKAQQKNKIKSNKKEKAGRAVLVVNTIITSCLGGWLGISAYSHIKLNNIITIVIIVLAFILGALIAISNFYLTNKKAKETLDKEKILSVKLLLINLIIKKREKIIERIKKNILKIINFDKQPIDITQDIKKFILDNSLDKLKNTNINLTHQASLKYTLNSIKKNIIRLQNLQKKHKSLNITLHEPSYINKLISENKKNAKKLPTVNQWIKKDISQILMNLIPTLLGGFASMFVLIDGIPTIMTHYKISFDLTESSILYLKILGLILAVSLTVYYGYSQIYSDYKDFFRQKQIEITEHHSTENYNLIINQLTLLRILTRLQHLLSYFKLIYSNIKNT